MEWLLWRFYREGNIGIWVWGIGRNVLLGMMGGDILGKIKSMNKGMGVWMGMFCGDK